MSFMGKCPKRMGGKPGIGLTIWSVLAPLFIGSLAGCLFGIVDSIVTFYLLDEDRSNVAQRLGRSVVEGGLAGAIFGSIFGGLKLLM